MRTLAGLNLGLRFLLELAAVGIAAWWGWRAGPGPWRFALVLVAPAAVVAVWGAFVSPKAAVAVPPLAALTIEYLVFGAAAAALVTLGHPGWGAAFAAVALVGGLLNRRWESGSAPR